MNLLKRLILWATTQELMNDADRPRWLKWLGIRMDEGVFIQSGCRFKHLDNIQLGYRVYLNHECLLEARAPIVLEQNVCLGPRVTIVTTTHEIGDSDRRVGKSCISKPVRVGAGTWICASANILPGVTIGPGCIIAAGALVRRDCKPNCLYAGVPARLIGRLNDETKDCPNAVTSDCLDESLPPSDRQGSDLAAPIPK